jgi:hypothetical protein
MTENPPSGINNVPESAAAGGENRSERRHWLEYAAVAFAGAALLASTAAAVFSGRQAWIASDTEERQLRAYLEVTDIEVVCPDCTTTAPVSPTTFSGRNFVHIRFENSGQTPAQAIRQKVNWWVIPSKNAPLPSSLDFPDYSPPNGSGLVSTSELARDKHRDGMASIDDDIDRFRAATTGTTTIYLYGHIDYCDVFGKPRATAFCFLYVPNVGEKLPICDRYNGEIKTLTIIAASIWGIFYKSTISKQRIAPASQQASKPLGARKPSELSQYLIVNVGKLLELGNAARHGPAGCG